MESIREIKEKLQSAWTEEEASKDWQESVKSPLNEFLTSYSEDTRKGVVSLCEKAKKDFKKLHAERERIESLKVYEREYEHLGYICGIDEVGRGPLAGPVVAGAVILPKDCKLLYLNDSKQLSEKKREELYDKIMEEAVAVAVGYASPARIDEINILQATYEAMREAISKLEVTPQILLNDAVTIPDVIIPQVPHFDWSSEYYRKSDEGPFNERVCEADAGIRLCFQ